MALYSYRCPICEDEFSEDHPMGCAPAFAECPECHTHSRRLIAMPNVHYKARGFTGAGKVGDGRIDHFRHADGSPLTEADKNRVPAHAEED